MAKVKKTKPLSHRMLERIIHFFRSWGNIASSLSDVYILNRWESSIKNDMGASFTSIERKGNKIIKRSLPEGEDKLIDEIEWYINAKKNRKLRKFCPKIYNYSTEPGNVYYTMKYYYLPNLRMAVVKNANARFFVRYRLRALVRSLKELFFTEENSAPVPPKFVEENHIAKLNSRMKDASKKSKNIRAMLEQDTLTVNNKTYISPYRIIDAFVNDNSIMKRLTPEKLYFSHGDLHGNNIMCGVNYNKLIYLDCRGKSPSGDDFYDPAYDIAKLYHDFNGLYSMIEGNLYSLFFSSDNNKIAITYDYYPSDVLKRFHHFYRYTRKQVRIQLDYIPLLNYRADFTEAVHFLTMVPFHLKTEREGIICMATGIKLLNDWCRYHEPDLYTSLKEKYIKE